MKIIPLLKNEFVNFASPILVNNLPSLDGLLPVQRKVIWALHKNRIYNDKPFIKLLRAGSMAMVYYTFGDLPLYSAMKNMANNGLNYYYLAPKGSFGDKRKKEGVGASPRYIECKLSKYSESMLMDIEKNIVPFKRNFDDTENEPIILPSISPNILTNMSQSIAVGEASKIPPHNLEDTCLSLMSYISTHDIDKSIDILKCPDFTGFGGKILYNKEEAYNIYKTGKGSFKLTGSYIYEENKNDLKISIMEVPYGTYIEDLECKLRIAYDKGLFKEIVDIHDSSDRNGIRLDIYVKKNTNLEQFESKLMKYTPYQTSFACNFTILDLDGKTPMLMSLQDIYDKWIIHRINCIKNGIQFDIDKNNIELNKLYGLIEISKDDETLDKAIKLIRSSKTENEAISKLQKSFKLNQGQLEYIATIRLVNMNKDWITNKTNHIKELEQDNINLNLTLNNKDEINNIITNELKECKKIYGQPRKTTIITESSIPQISTDSLIEDFNTVVQLTSESYLKKIPATSMRGNTTNKLKDGDKIIYQENSTNKSVILVFTSLGFCYKLYQHEIEDFKTSQLGLYLPQELQLEKDENIVGLVCTTDYNGNLIEIFQNGKIAKISLQSFSTESKRTKLKNALSLESPLVKMFSIPENTDIDLLLQSSLNKVLITNTSIIEPKATKNIKGNIVMKSKKNSIVSLAEPLDNINTELLDIDYYKGTTGVGTFLKKDDKIELLMK